MRLLCTEDVCIIINFVKLQTYAHIPLFVKYEILNETKRTM